MYNSKNIIYHHRTRGVGAEGVHIRGIASALRNKGFHVDIVSFPGTDPEEEKSSAPLNKQKKSSLKKNILEKVVKILPQIAFEILELIYNAITFVRLSKLLKRDIYFVYERYSLFLFITVWICKHRNIPIILEINDSALVERVRPLLLKRLAKRIEKWVFTNATGLVFISTKFKDLVKQEYDSVAPYVITPNGADISIFNPNKFDRDKIRKTLSVDNKVVCGYVGAFVYWHGIHWFIEIIKDKIKKYPDLVLLLIGDGKMFEDVKNIVEKNNLSTQIILTGRVPHNRVSELISAMDYAFLPDSNIYGSPMKMFELMAMGVGVIAPNFPPIDEVINDKENGWLFPAGDRQACVQYTLDLSKNKDELIALGERAKNYIINKRQWSHNADGILSLLP